MRGRRPSPDSVDSRLFAIIRGRGRGSVFVAAEFLWIGSRMAVDQALHRMAGKGTIRRLDRGLYDFPKVHPVQGPILPSAETVVRAIAGRDRTRTRLQPAGAYAANTLGLSKQVPTKLVFLTDGPTRNVKLGTRTIQLRRTTAKNMATAGRLSGLLIQALRELGIDTITPKQRAYLIRTLSANKRRELIKDLKLAPVWMHEIFRELAAK